MRLLPFTLVPLAVAAGAALLAGRTVAPLTAAPPAVEVLSDLTYARPGGSELQLDLARPRGAKGRLPAVLVIHGGGWVGGSRKQHDDLIQVLAGRGYVAATVSYRFAPLHRWPAQMQDVQAAVGWLRESAATYGIDPERVGAMGFSAGAHLAMLLGSVDAGDGLDGPGKATAASAKVQAVVSWFGPTDLTSDDYPEAARRLIEGLLGAQVAEGKGGASPVRYVSRGDAPMLLIHGTKDMVVPVSQATLMGEALTQAGVAGEVRLLVGQNHGWNGSLLADTLEDSIRWFDRHLKGVLPTLPRPR